MPLAASGATVLVMQSSAHGASAFQVAITAGRGRAVFRLAGELDLAGAEQVDRFVDLVARAGLPATLDCGGITFVDVAGIRSLIRARDHGCSVREVPSIVRRLLDILDLSHLVLGSLPAAA
jgi:anti-anti-sigma factor